MAHIHSVYDTDPHFKIDPISKAIINQSETKTKLMKGDHNSERFTFEIPRLVDGHDMSLCNKVEIHYLNIDAATKETSADVYPVEDMQLSPESADVVIFSWLISKNATKYAGLLNFFIHFKCVTDSTIDYKWSPDIYKGIQVGDGIDNSEAVIEEYSDVLEAWKKEIEQRFADCVPLLKVLDAREEAETGRPWYTKPQNAYPRVYTESTATKAPYNKHFLTDRPVAPVDPNGRAAVYGKGVYFTKMDEVLSAAQLLSGKAKANATDSPFVEFSADKVADTDWLNIYHKTDGNNDRELWIYPSTSDNSLGDGKKVIIEFDMKLESFKALSGESYDKGWTFKIAPLFDGKRAITTSAGNNSSLLVYVDEEAIRVRVNNVSEITYKHDPTSIFNFKLAMFNKKYYVYINDYLMGTGDSVLNTDTATVFSRMGIFLNAKDSVKFSIANVFCGIVEGENELSGRYLGSIPVRRQNGHILVPGKLSDYVPCKLKGLDPKEYALSYGAALELIDQLEAKVEELEARPIAVDNSTEGLAYELSEDGTYYICTGIGTVDTDTITDIVIANEYNGLPVKAIANRAFSCDEYGADYETKNENSEKNLKITSVYIPENVIDPGSETFYASIMQASSLRSVVFAENSKMTEIGDTFYLAGIRTLILPKSIQKIGHFVIYDSGVNTVILKSKPEMNYPFEFAFGLRDIHVPWAEGEVEGAPWGVPHEEVTIHYNSPLCAGTTMSGEVKVEALIALLG